MRRSWTILVASLVAALVGPSALAGEVRGTVDYRGDEPRLAPLPVTKDAPSCGSSVQDESLQVGNGRLANVAVTLRGGPSRAPRRATLDQRGCRFVPHVQVAPVGSTLDLLNADPVLHSVHGWLGHASRFNMPTPPGPGAAASIRLDRAGLIQVRCDVHGWMRAYVLVADGPAAVTGPEGTFTLGEVPPGTYSLTAWHERLGEKTIQVVVPADGTAISNFTFGG